MKHVFLSLLILLAGFTSRAQFPGWDWVDGYGGTGSEFGRSVVTDAGGNVYITGQFQNSVTFGSMTLTSNGDYDIFVVKYSATGSVLWATSAGGTGFEGGFGIAVDSSGVYITGEFENPVNFGTSTLISNGGSDIFIAKYSTTGSFLWAASDGGVGHESGGDIAVDNSGNVYVSGVFEDSVSFGTTTLISNGGEDLFLSKYSSNGSIIWATSAGGTGSESANNIGIDPSGNIYISGRFQHSVTFGTTTLTSVGGFDIFFAKYNASGSVLWATSAGGSGFEYALGIAIDGSGNMYVTGQFENPVTFGSLILFPAGGTDIFIAKYSTTGSFIWATKAGGPGTDRGYAIAVDDTGNVYVTGNIENSVSFGSTNLTSIGGLDIFVAKYNTSGSVLWATNAGGTGSELARGIAVDESGNIYVTGGFSSATISFGTTTLANAGSFTTGDIFLAKIGLSVGVQNVLINEPPGLYPNPTSGSFVINLPDGKLPLIVILNVQGSIIHFESTNTLNAIYIQLKDIVAGVYFVKVIYENGVFYKEVAVMR